MNNRLFQKYFFHPDSSRTFRILYLFLLNIAILLLILLVGTPDNDLADRPDWEIQDEKAEAEAIASLEKKMAETLPEQQQVSQGKGTLADYIHTINNVQ